MMIFWAVVLVVAVLMKRRRRQAVRLLYRANPTIVGSEAVFACGCRFNLADNDSRVICQAHQAIIAAEVEA